MCYQILPNCVSLVVYIYSVPALNQPFNAFGKVYSTSQYSLHTMWKVECVAFNIQNIISILAIEEYDPPFIATAKLSKFDIGSLISFTKAKWCTWRSNINEIKIKHVAFLPGVLMETMMMMFGDDVDDDDDDDDVWCTSFVAFIRHGEQIFFS